MLCTPHLFRVSLDLATPESPFVKTFNYGQDQEGYWNYDTMIIQFEDVVDCLNVLYDDLYEYVFYFDHSSGHDRLRPDGLNANLYYK